MRAQRAAAACLLAAAAIAVGACGGGGGGSTSDSGSVTTVERTQSSPQKTVVVQSQGGSFNPEAIYQSASPGVVTIRSIFPAAASPASSAGAVARRPRAPASCSTATARSSPTRTWSPSRQRGGAARSTRPRRSTSSSPTATWCAAKIVGFDPFADVALLKVDPDGLDLHPLPLGDQRAGQVGQPVAAIGSPFGEQQSLSVGVVSATDRSIESLTEFQIEGAIQTDAAINPGNSGGPLLDADAAVIGINQQIRPTRAATTASASRCRSASSAHSLDELRQDGEVEYAYIGVSTQPLYPQLADRLGLPTDDGALVAKVISGGPADRGGPQGRATRRSASRAAGARTGGDVIVAIDGHKIVSETDLPAADLPLQPGRHGAASRSSATARRRPST